MSKEKYFSSYKSPNIVIIPTSSENEPAFKKAKIYNKVRERFKENAQNCQENLDSMFQANNISGSTDVAQLVCLHDNITPSTIPESKGDHKQEEIPREKDQSLVKFRKKINENFKLTLRMPDVLTRNKICNMENVSKDSNSNKSEAILKEYSSLPVSIDKNSKKCTNMTGVTSRFKEPSNKSRAWLKKHIADTINKNKLSEKSISKVINSNEMRSKNEEINSIHVKTENNLISLKPEIKSVHHHVADIHNKNENSMSSTRSPTPNEIKRNNTLINNNESQKNLDNIKKTCSRSETYVCTEINKNIKENFHNNLTSSPNKSDFPLKTMAQNHKHNKKKPKRPKTIKIVINVTYNNLHETINKKEIKDSELDKNTDLSFLDDFDIDDVVESLFSCKNAKENTLGSKENLKETIKNENDTNSSSKKMKISNTLPSKLKIKKKANNNFKFTKPVKKENKSEIKKIEHEEYHLSSDLKSVQHIVTYSNDLDGKLLKKTDVGNLETEQSINEEVGNIMQTKTNSKTETKIKSEVINDLDNMHLGSKFTVYDNAINSKEISKDSKSDTINNVKDKGAVNEKFIRKQVKVRQKILSDENTKSEQLFAQHLEAKMFHVLKEKYSVKAVTHYGKFSKILKCENSVTGKFYAAKILNRESNLVSKAKNKEKILKELQKDIPLENLSCTFLISSFELDTHWCYMTHYYPISLQQILQEKRIHFHIDQIRNLSMQLIQAVVILRNKNIVHSDIRPGHILLNSGIEKLKLCGFDEAYYYSSSNNLSPYTGTVNYRSPEIILGYSDGFSIDVWSTGLVMHEMVTSCMLFTGVTNNEILYEQICTCGNFPYNMIMHSRFKRNHFNGTTFIRTGLCDKDKVSTNNFGNKRDIKSLVFDAYKKHWGGTNKNENIKLQAFCSLLNKMFILNPKHRLPIEYVYANSFFLQNDYMKNTPFY